MHIDVYSDIACPWCYIGERRLEAAMRQRPDVEIVRHWRPFQLQPGLPMVGIPWREFAPRKFGSAERAAQMFGQVASAGAPDGIDFRFDQVATAANTRDAHRLILLAAEHGREWPMAEVLFKAYFTDGCDLNDLETLVELASLAGLAEADTRQMLASGSYASDVDGSQQTAAQLGISGVPFFVIDERYGLSGAQPVEVFLQAIDQVSAEQ
ncbi:MAG: DsbA family oxidoreductase [Roseiflexaceae bacterium]|nr:DsbA family oxidoreductase [Roseiflexaceae bacterium]